MAAMDFDANEIPQDIVAALALAKRQLHLPACRRRRDAPDSRSRGHAGGVGSWLQGRGGRIVHAPVDRRFLVDLDGRPGDPGDCRRVGMTGFPIFEAELEIRAKGGRRSLRGRFPYSPGPGRKMATVRDRGKVRKERIGPDAFGWQMREFAKVQKQYAEAIQSALDRARIELLRQELERRNVHILAGHDFNKPLGDLKGGTATVTSTREAVDFAVELPADGEMPSYMSDTVRMVQAGLIGGVSPGFRVPPASVVANAEALEPEPGNPGVSVRVINQAVPVGIEPCDSAVLCRKPISTCAAFSRLNPRRTCGACRYGCSCCGLGRGDWRHRDARDGNPAGRDGACRTLCPGCARSDQGRSDDPVRRLDCAGPGRRAAPRRYRRYQHVLLSGHAERDGGERREGAVVAVAGAPGRCGMTALRPGRFPDTIVRRRQLPGGYDIYGEWVPGALADTELAASIQPLALEDSDFAGGEMLQHRLKVYSPEPDSLVAAFDDREADKVLIGDATIPDDCWTYTVQESRSWPAGHCRAILLRET